jgi:iron complex outermembrane recepter protein
MNQIETSATNRRAYFKTMLASGIALGALASTPAFAQSTKPAAEEAAQTDIIVTARRTDEKLQDVPVSVTAFGAEQLAEQRILSESDLQATTPGLLVRQTVSNNQINFSLRGQTVDAFSGTAPAVVVYMNEVQVGGAGTQSFFDLQSIQVLKGPQGTLFGRNATGGAILYQVVKPTHEFGGYVTAGYGKFNNIELNGAINLPIGEGAAVRLGASYRKRDGYQRNLALGGLESNQIDYQAYRASLLLDPIDGFENVTTFQYNTDDGRGSGLKLSSINNRDALGNPPKGPDGITNLATPTSDIYNGGLNGTLGAATLELARARAAGFYDFYNSETNNHKSRQYFISNKTSYELSDSAKLTNIFGYNNARSHDIVDVDGAGLPWIIIGNVPNSQIAAPGAAFPNTEGYNFYTKQWSNETQLSGKIIDDKLNYIVGVYFGDVKQGTNTPTCAFCDVQLGIPGIKWGNQNRFNGERENKSKAVFAQLTYKIADQLSVTGGYRHTWENQSITRENDDPSTQALNSQTKFSSLKVNKPSWTFSLDYKPTEALLFYVAQRGSFRTAGYNIDNTVPDSLGRPSNNSYKTETTYDYEIGVKFAGDLGSVRSRINLALYNQTVKNIQRAVYLGIASVTGNVNKARIRGFELDANFNFSDNFEFGGSLAHTDAIYKDPRAVAAAQNFIYGPYGDSPKWTGSVFAKVSQDLSNDGGNVYLRGEVYGQSSFYYSNLANSLTPNTQIKKYALVNMRAGIDNIAGSSFSLMAYVQNLTQKKYEVGGLDLGAVIGTSARLVGTPRTFGIQGTYKF